MKICYKCGAPKPLDAFHNTRSNKDGKAGQCKTCSNTARIANARKNPERERAKFLAWTAANNERYRAISKQYRETNSERLKAYVSDWKNRNRGKVREACSRRKTKIRRATPPCLTPEDFAYMAAVYQAGEELGLQVDHYVPIIHPLVCGLHVPWNLQLLTPAENRAKSNKFEIV
jgi:hypothetical protein